jgi:myo-inositol 2-dehydrogenase/D-chiro-inositol 1-dehydrogenase
MSALRIGWIGCGTHAGEMLLPQLVRHEAQIAAICDIDDERLTRIGLRYGVAEKDRYRDWRELLARADLDGIGMAVGPAGHAEIGRAIIDRGLPLFMEKPPAADATAARALANHAAATRARVVTGFMKRYSTANRIAINLLRDKTFGHRASFLGEYMTAPTYFARDPDYTGFFLHHCIHYMDLVPHLMGEVANISARRHQLAPGKLLLHVDFRFESGGLGTLVMGTHQSRGTPMEWWQVMGDHARVEVRNVHEVRLYRDPPFKADKADATLAEGVDTLVWEPNLTAAANEDHKGYSAILADYLAVARGEARNAPGLEDGARAMELLERVMRCGSYLTSNEMS